MRIPKVSRAILSVCLLLSVNVFAQQTASPPHRAPETNHARRNEKPAESAPPLAEQPKASSSVSQLPTSIQSPEHKQNSWCQAFAPNTWSNWVLVVIGIAGTLV